MEYSQLENIQDNSLKKFFQGGEGGGWYTEKNPIKGTSQIGQSFRQKLLERPKFSQVLKFAHQLRLSVNRCPFSCGSSWTDFMLWMLL